MKEILIALAMLTTLPAVAAESPLLSDLRAAARQENPSFKEFSAARGESFYNAKQGDIGCTSCHTASPKNAGKHAKTGKEILPLAPSVNAERFTDAAKVEKWFKRNCNEVLQRACTAQEKGDFIAYVQSVK